ncbi:MAG: hypothetical protein GX410_08370 [Elusimicrobia bacterium]|nr:hypothetical protein [Elusimicrobiota bacterium]
MIKILLSLMLAANCHAAQAGKEKKNVQPKTRPATIEGVCDFDMPYSWTLEEKPYARQTGVVGLKLAAPDSSSENPAIIYADYYPADNKIGVSSATYMERLTAKGTLNPTGRKAGKPHAAALGALKASAVEIESVSLYPPEAMNPRKIVVKEKVVVAGTDGGFFVLSCYAAKARYRQVCASLDSALKTFRLLPTAQPKTR